MIKFFRADPSNYKYTLSNANLYLEPSTSAKIVTSIPLYKKVTILDGAEDWYKITYDHETGYIPSDELSITKYTWKDALLRPYADANTNPIALVPAKSKVQVLSTTGDWSHVNYNNQTGYIFSDLLTDDGNSPAAYDFTYFSADMLRFVNENNIKSPTNHLITTDLDNKITYIFEKSTSSLWQQIYVWSCTVGKPSTPTIQGTFYVAGRKPYFGTDQYRVKYATRIKGSYYYHSILFNAEGTEIINAELGKALSHGCIRLAVSNAQWIYDNILDATTIVIH